MTDLDWPMIALAGWFAVSLGCFAHQVWQIWRPKSAPKPDPLGIQILHRAADAVGRHQGDKLPLFCPTDTPSSVFAAVSNLLDSRRQ